MRKYLLVAITIVTALSANPKAFVDSNIPKVSEIGGEASAMLFSAMVGKLKAKMKEGEGSAKLAAEFCSKEAQPITENINSKLKDGVSIKRISIRNRNPKNAPATEQERKTLKAFEILSKLSTDSLIQKTKTGYKYYKPISIAMGVCLKCHGDEKSVMDKDAKEIFDKHYPNDKARNHKIGDFRGAIVVDINKGAIK